MRKVMLVFIGLAVLSCAKAVIRAPTVPDMAQTFATESEAWAAYTVCGTRPRSWYAEEQLDSPGLDGIRAHEAGHRDIASEHATCSEYIAWLNMPVNRLRAEATAFCFQSFMEYDRQRYPSLGSAFIAFGKQLASPPYGFKGLDAETAAELISISCRATGNGMEALR